MKNSRPYRCKAVTKERLIKRIKEVVGPLSTPCWEWQGHKNSISGYGLFEITVDGQRHAIAAHRASYELFNGPITEGLFVLHKCDNRPCINPDHLFVGTQTENMIDCVNKKRHSFGERNGLTKLSDKKVMHIKILLKDKKLTFKEIAAKFGVDATTVFKIKKGKTWKHLKDKPVWSTPTITELNR